ncbi:hypothetical protein GGR57DRAFT_477849 [Xylariaceae sp. FL1272]|nr:hypothetical protein GGR57DRAFT_477849 [Xylariaceae sp. FL1272]
MTILRTITAVLAASSLIGAAAHLEDGNGNPINDQPDFGYDLDLNQTDHIMNGDFETCDLSHWNGPTYNDPARFANGVEGKVAVCGPNWARRTCISGDWVYKVTCNGQASDDTWYSVELSQELFLVPGLNYRFNAWAMGDGYVRITYNNQQLLYNYVGYTWAMYTAIIQAEETGILIVNVTGFGWDTQTTLIDKITVSGPVRVEGHS